MKKVSATKLAAAWRQVLTLAPAAAEAAQEAWKEASDAAVAARAAADARERAAKAEARAAVGSRSSRTPEPRCLIISCPLPSVRFFARSVPPGWQVVRSQEARAASEEERKAKAEAAAEARRQLEAERKADRRAKAAALVG